ncbi:MAG: hypothetical protein AAFP90_23695, partial [Planctomycetota bacterium]
YNAFGEMTSLTDPVGNTTSWSFDALGRTISETAPTGAVAAYEYDAVSNLIAETDRRGKRVQFPYDSLDQLTQENWIDAGSTIRTIDFAYDLAGNLRSVSDPSVDYVYTHDALNRVTQRTTDYAAAMGTLQLDFEYDSVGQTTDVRLQSNASGFWVNDFHNAMAYDALGRMTSITQQSQFGGASVGPKHVEFDYDANGRFTGIQRYADSNANPFSSVAESSFTYDNAGRITILSHAGGFGAAITDYWYAHDTDNRMIQLVTSSTAGVSGTSDILYDSNDQITGVTHSHITDESYAFDSNGNRTTGTIVDTWNRLIDDSTFTYTYDADGNRLSRVRKSSAAADDHTTNYAWDHRGRLIGITTTDNSGAETKSIRFR